MAEAAAVEGPQDAAVQHSVEDHPSLRGAAPGRGRASPGGRVSQHLLRWQDGRSTLWTGPRSISTTPSAVATRSTERSWGAAGWPSRPGAGRRHRGGDGRVRPDPAGLPKERVLQIGVAAALAEAPSARADADAARDDEVDRRHLVHGDRATQGEGALDGGGLPQVLRAQLCRVEPEKGRALRQLGHREEDRLAGLEGRVPDRALGQVGVALEHPGRLEGGVGDEVPRGGLGPDEFGSAPGCRGSAPRRRP